jgi:hypothetical protein
MRADDNLRGLVLAAVRLDLGEGLDNARMITAEVREDIADPGFG